MNQKLQLILAILLSTAISACGTDSSSGEQAAESENVSSTDGVSVILPDDGGAVARAGFSLRLTDAPVDGLLAVVMKFATVKLRSTDGDWTTYEFDHGSQPSIDLLGLQGTKTADLLVDMDVKSGDYDEIRLVVSDEPMTNHVQPAAGPAKELKIPSGSSSGLKVKGNFSITETRPVSLVIDLDLRQSVTKAGNSGKYTFKPVLRLVDNDNAGHIRGTVDPALLSDDDCSDDDVDTFNAVYVYAGHDAVTADIDQGSNVNQPVTTTSIAYDNASMSYVFEAAFLPEGDYTIAFTCNADEEELDDDDDDLEFFGKQNVTVDVNNIVFL